MFAGISPENMAWNTVPTYLPKRDPEITIETSVQQLWRYVYSINVDRCNIDVWPGYLVCGVKYLGIQFHGFEW